MFNYVDLYRACIRCDDIVEDFEEDNVDDFFAFLEQRIEELKFKYKDLERKF